MKEYLPIGSVITLKNGTKKLMIVGRCQTQLEQNKQFDYGAVLYPEGLIDSSHFYLFNQEDISNIYYIGMQDVEEFNYRIELNKMIEEAKHEKN